MKKLNDTGFTLIELLISIAIASIMGSLIASSFWQQQRSHNRQLEASAVQQNLRASMYVAGREIRLAGYEPHSIRGSNLTAITDAQSNTLTFSYEAAWDGTDNDNDGDTDEPGELETVTYSLYDAYSDGDTDLGRDSGTQTALAENIDGLEFYYTLDDGTRTVSPTADQIEDIRAIQMTILARTENPFQGNPATNETFTGPGGTSLGTYNDSYRRLMLSTNIICRNAG